MDFATIRPNGSTLSNNERQLNVLNYATLETLDYWPNQAILICLYGSISFISFVLNSVTISVLLKYSNIYSELNAYLINQSVSDIVMAFWCIPFTYTNFILNRWPFPHFLCPLGNFAQICSVLVSVWNLTLIGIERFLTIVSKPNRINQKRISKIFSQTSNWKKILYIGAIWLFAIFSGSAQFLYTRVVPVEYNNRTHFECRENMPEQTSQLYTIYLFVSSFALPALILAYVYTRIGYRVWRHATVPRTNQQQHQNNSQSQNHMEKVSKMMLLIVLLFFLCWLPLQIFTLFASFRDTFLLLRSPLDYHLLVYGYLLCHLLAMSHSFMNPLVYCCISRQFSQNFCSVMQRFLHRFQSCFIPSLKKGTSTGTGLKVNSKCQEPPEITTIDTAL